MWSHAIAYSVPMTASLKSEQNLVVYNQNGSEKYDIIVKNISRSSVYDIIDNTNSKTPSNYSSWQK